MRITALAICLLVPAALLADDGPLVGFDPGAPDAAVLAGEPGGIDATGDSADDSSSSDDGGVGVGDPESAKAHTALQTKIEGHKSRIVSVLRDLGRDVDLCTSIQGEPPAEFALQDEGDYQAALRKLASEVVGKGEAEIFEALKDADRVAANRQAFQDVSAYLNRKIAPVRAKITSLEAKKSKTPKNSLARLKLYEELEAQREKLAELEAQLPKARKK